MAETGVAMSKLQTLKKRYGLETDRAGDLKSNVYLWGIVAVILDKVADHILGMASGWVQTVLLVLFLGALSFISWLTVGDNKKPGQDGYQEDDEPEQLGDSAPISDVLREARRP